ncbi:hypothetical protein K449DRAFT_442927 [Hypoxylon sp. EC38]|nr:hypothetical protein K449DRAFT_442927 [Hypoxylon sp. EC38]
MGSSYKNEEHLGKMNFWRFIATVLLPLTGEISLSPHSFSNATSRPHYASSRERYVPNILEDAHQNTSGRVSFMANELPYFQPMPTVNDQCQRATPPLQPILPRDPGDEIPKSMVFECRNNSQDVNHFEKQQLEKLVLKLPKQTYRYPDYFRNDENFEWPLNSKECKDAGYQRLEMPLEEDHPFEWDYKAYNNPYNNQPRHLPHMYPSGFRVIYVYKEGEDNLLCGVRTPGNPTRADSKVINHGEIS